MYRNFKIFLIGIFVIFMLSCASSRFNQNIVDKNDFVDIKKNKIDYFIPIELNNTSKINEGKFEGWGTSLCWWGNKIGYNDIVSEKAVKALFDKDDGLGLNIIRYNIGGGDNPVHNHITRDDSIMPGFMKYNESTNTYEYDWNADKNQRNVLKKINEIADENLIVEFFSNSPPYFMTNSGCSSGAKYAWQDNLKENCVVDFSDYLVTVSEKLMELDGIKVTSLEPMNEPASTTSWKAYSKKQEGCHISIGKAQDNLIINTKEALLKNNLQDIKLAIGDETYTRFQYKALSQLPQTTIDLIDRINTHTYGGGKEKELYYFAVKNGKNLWISETDSFKPLKKNIGQMGHALGLAKKIITDLNSLKPSAWVMWQAIAGYSNTLPDNNRDFWGCLVADLKGDELLLTKKYYSYMHFTKFINPGDKIVYLNSECAIASMNEKEELKIICYNEKNKTKKITFDLRYIEKSYSQVDEYITLGTTIENGYNCERCNENFVQIKNNLLTSELPPYSICSFVITR